MASEPTVSPNFIVRQKRTLAQRLRSGGRWLLIPVGLVILLVLSSILWSPGTESPEPSVEPLETSDVVYTSQVAYSKIDDADTEIIALPETEPTPIFSVTADGSVVVNSSDGATCKASTRNAANVNIRSGPDLDYDVVGTLQNGDMFPIIGKTEDGWYKTSMLGGGAGWVAGSVINQSGECDSLPEISLYQCVVEHGTAKVNIRSGPGIKYSVVATVPNNAKLTADARDGDWYRLVMGYQTGWASSDVISLKGPCENLGTTTESRETVSESTTSTVSNTITDDESCRVHSYDGTPLDLREGPGMNYDVVAVLNDTQPSTLRSDNGWYRIDDMGWAFMPELLFDGDCSSLPRIASVDVAQSQ